MLAPGSPGAHMPHLGLADPMPFSMWPVPFNVLHVTVASISKHGSAPLKLELEAGTLVDQDTRAAAQPG